MPKRAGVFMMTSLASICVSRMRAIVPLWRSRTPSTSPPRASAELMRAIARALPMPPAAGISAARHARVVGSVASRIGPPSRDARLDRTRCRAGEVVVQASGRRHQLGDALVVHRVESDVEVGAERFGDFLAEEGADGAAVDAPHELALQEPLGDRVVSDRGARLPPRRLLGEVGADLVPLVEIRGGERRVEAREAGAVTHHVPHEHVRPCRSARTRASTARPARRGRAHRDRRASARRARPSSSCSSTR